MPSDEWEVVCVFENSMNPADADRLRVMVLGVQDVQPIENFEWGAGPLVAPTRKK